MSQNTAVKQEESKRPVSRKDMTALQWTLKEMKRNYLGYLFLAPFYILFLMFTIIPVVLSLFICFTHFNMLEPPKWIFLDNFIRLFLEDDIFLICVKNTLIFAIVTGPASYMLSFFVAWFINELPPKIRAVVTLVFYAPSIAGSVYMIWQTLFSSDAHGWVNGTLIKLGLIDTPIHFFKDPTYMMPLCIVVALWCSLGTAFLSFIAGLQTVDRSLYEAGAVDGVKNRWQELWYITLPVMKPQLMFGAIMAITGSFNFGGIVSALCGDPSTDYACHTITHHLGDYGGARMEIGYSSAIAMILFFMMVGANQLVQKMLAKVGQ